MSWTLYAQVKDGKDSQEQSTNVVEALHAAKQAQLDQQPFDSFDDDVEEQIDIAIFAAGEFANRGGFRRGVNVNMSGHAARGDTDYVTINVNVTEMAPDPAPKEK